MLGAYQCQIEWISNTEGQADIDARIRGRQCCAEGGGHGNIGSTGAEDRKEHRISFPETTISSNGNGDGSRNDRKGQSKSHCKKPASPQIGNPTSGNQAEIEQKKTQQPGEEIAHEGLQGVGSGCGRYHSSKKTAYQYENGFIGQTLVEDAAPRQANRSAFGIFQSCQNKPTQDSRTLHERQGGHHVASEGNLTRIQVGRGGHKSDRTHRSIGRSDSGGVRHVELPSYDWIDDERNEKRSRSGDYQGKDDIERKRHFLQFSPSFESEREE